VVWLNRSQKIADKHKTKNKRAIWSQRYFQVLEFQISEFGFSKFRVSRFHSFTVV